MLNDVSCVGKRVVLRHKVVKHVRRDVGGGGGGGVTSIWLRQTSSSSFFAEHVEEEEPAIWWNFSDHFNEICFIPRFKKDSYLNIKG